MAGGSPETPDAPEPLDTRETPDIPDNPDTRESSEIGDARDTPDTRETPETRDTPDTRETSRAEATHLLVRAGEYVCALPLAAVQRVLRALPIHPLPGASPELKGLTEFAGDPLPVLDLARLARAPQGANPVYPVTVIAWVGGGDSRELVGLAADAALAVAHVAAAAVVGGDGALVAGETVVGGKVVRVIDLEALGRAS
jgi:chemotaxis signal transduction protein